MTEDLNWSGKKETPTSFDDVISFFARINKVVYGINPFTVKGEKDENSWK